MRKLIWVASGLLAGLICAGVVAEVYASRNSSGTMSAVNGPYVPNQTIASSLFNNRYSDIEAEITDSLSRSGKGPMLSPLKNVDGTKASPAFTFNTETASGLYRAASNDIRMSVNNTDVEKWLPTGPVSVLPHTFTGTAADGSIILTPLAAPSAPSNGALWVETTSNVAKARINGATKTILTSPAARTDLPTVGQQVSSSCGVASTTSGTYADITNLTVTFTTTGRPVMLILQPDGGSATQSTISISTSAQTARIGFVRDGTLIQEFRTGGVTATGTWFTPQMIALDAAPSAASHTYKIQAMTTGGAQVNITDYVLVAYEL